MTLILAAAIALRVAATGLPVRPGAPAAETRTAPGAAIVISFCLTCAFVFTSGVHYEQTERLDFSEPLFFDRRDVVGVNATLAYDGHKGFTGDVKAHYLWWDMTEFWGSDSAGVVVDLSIANKFLDTGSIALELFGSAHNIFNAQSYNDRFHQNPEQWLEAGLRCTF